MGPEVITREELNRWAATWERYALRADSAAREWAEIAADPTQSRSARIGALRATRTVRANAAEYRAEAAVMRGGEVPESYWHLYTTDPDATRPTAP
ncbi:hypothetical protein ABZV75_38475 [Streptomyces flaveolus]|uniref:hypothetical protein n=1 Tax=Streptomyces flaveolus TaxID=67297 RepID=UPI0033A20F5B